MSIQQLMESLSHQNVPASTLYVIATPIGNIGDISLRALHILGLADLIACEDTRTSKQLLSGYGLSSELVSAHKHNEREAAGYLIERLKRGERIRACFRCRGRLPCPIRAPESSMPSGKQD